MPDWNEIKCYECVGKCNKKGYPSVTKGSPHCKSQRGLFSKKKEQNRKTFLTRIKGWLGRSG